jgi:hypothetical protein
MPKPQTPESHAALDPITHFTILPLGLVLLALSIWRLSAGWPAARLDHTWMILASLAIILLNLKSRVYSLAVQDRVIRQEERLRLAALLPAADHARIPHLSTRQLIALRFASDAELPTLVHRTLAEDLTPKAIKQSIATWRPDHQRI